MTELKVAKRMIEQLLKKIQIKAIENDYLTERMSEQELYKLTHELKSCPESFEKKELEQMIRTVVKLTGNRYLTADEISELINVNKSDILQVL